WELMRWCVFCVWCGLWWGGSGGRARCRSPSVGCWWGGCWFWFWVVGVLFWVGVLFCFLCLLFCCGVGGWV
ncbi:hypothetical protein RA268_28245, partial [Pseudomonas syringae pv. tagetis]